MIVMPPSFWQGAEYRKWLAAFGLAALGHWSLVWALGDKAEPAPEPLAMSAVMLNFAELPQSAMKIEPVAIGLPQEVTQESIAEPLEPPPTEPTEPPKVVVEESPEPPKVEIVVEKQPKKPLEKPKEKPKKVVKKPIEKPREHTKPVEKPIHQAQVSNVNSQASANSSAAAPKGDDSQTVAPNNSVAASKSLAQNWQSKVLGHLARHQQYPASARENGVEGTPWVNIVLDEQGRVLNVSLRKSSGANVLDNEALALIQRASPLPAPPQNVLQNQRVTFAVPIRFNLKAFYQMRR